MNDDAATLLARALTAVTAGLAVFDERDLCVAASPSFARIAWRCPPADVIGRSPADLPPDAERRTFEPRSGLTWSMVEIPNASTPNGDLLEALVNAIPAMISAKDAKSRYLFMNAYQSALYGVRYGEAIGRTAGELLGPDYGRYTRSLDERVLESGEPVANLQEEYADSRGVEHQWLTTKVPFRHGEAGAHDGVATLAVEVSELKRVEAELREARRNALELSRMKSAFIANMSHEVRNPLNAIVGFAELLATEPFGALGDERYRGYSRDIVAAARHLTQLVGDALDIASLEVGRLSFEDSAVGLRNLARDSARFVALEAAAKSISIDVDVPGEIPSLWIDRRRLKQVLINLLSNAVKYTPRSGRVSLTVSRLDDGSVAIDVADSGPGMSERDIEIALTPFGRAAGSFGVVGSGLGLPIAKSLIEAQGGSLEIHSAPGGGTTARVNLPRERALDFVLDTGED